MDQKHVSLLVEIASESFMADVTLKLFDSSVGQHVVFRMRLPHELAFAKHTSPRHRIALVRIVINPLYQGIHFRFPREFSRPLLRDHFWGHHHQLTHQLIRVCGKREKTEKLF